MIQCCFLRERDRSVLFPEGGGQVCDTVLFPEGGGQVCVRVLIPEGGERFVLQCCFLREGTGL